jgi:hypothetical protein
MSTGFRMFVTFYVYGIYAKLLTFTYIGFLIFFSHAERSEASQPGQERFGSKNASPGLFGLTDFNNEQ